MLPSDGWKTKNGGHLRLPNRTSDAPLTMGVDVAKATLEVGFSDREATLALSNDEVGLRCPSDFAFQRAALMPLFRAEPAGR